MDLNAWCEVGDTVARKASKATMETPVWSDEEFPHGRHRHLPDLPIRHGGCFLQALFSTSSAAVRSSGLADTNRSGDRGPVRPVATLWQRAGLLPLCPAASAGGFSYLARSQPVQSLVA